MRPSRRITAILATLLVAGMAAVFVTVRRLDSLRPASTLEDVLYISSPQLVKRMSLGYDGLLADIYWTRAVQYYGRRHVMLARHYNLLAPLLEITTTLDPHLIVAYDFGSSFLAQKPPQGAGLPDKAVQLVEYGIRNNPDEWRLYYDLGFIQYMERKDYAAAADAFRRGSERPGAHPWLKVLAARMAERGGDIETARFLWTKTYESSQDKNIRSNALAHLRALKVDEDVPRLEEVARRYRERTGRYPQNFIELARAGWLPGIPVDPLRRPYQLVPGGKVEVQDPDMFPFITEGTPPGYRPPAAPKPEVWQQQ
jgi:tetratricopeptide (TPR) repeat protein